MGRKALHEEHENHERWLVSYADFITLLFAFFVVMYSISSVNEGKYRVLSDSMVSAFRSPTSSLEPVQIGELVRSPLMMPDQINDVSETPMPIITPMLKSAKGKGEGEEEKEPQPTLTKEQLETQKALDQARKEVDEIAGHVEEQLDSLIDTGMINVKRNAFWVEVEIKSSLLFPVGNSQLSFQAIDILKKLSGILADVPNRVRVEGFTDNQPISTTVFPSNWELSTARAAAVVRLFEENGVSPDRMAAIGYGEHHPIADNLTDEGRAKNRRVVVVVVASGASGQDQRMFDFDLFDENV